jgi:hypothetical protein
MSLSEDQTDRVRTIETMVEILISELEGSEGRYKTASHRHLRMTRIAIQKVLGERHKHAKI